MFLSPVLDVEPIIIEMAYTIRIIFYNLCLNCCMYVCVCVCVYISFSSHGFNFNLFFCLYFGCIQFDEMIFILYLFCMYFTLVDWFLVGWLFIFWTVFQSRRLSRSLSNFTGLLFFFLCTLVDGFVKCEIEKDWMHIVPVVNDAKMRSRLCAHERIHCAVIITEQT